MTRHRLENSRWGFPTRCFVCDESNPRGLRIPFWHDDDKAAVVADVELGEAFSGAPTYVHGGVVLALMDEAMAWATIALAHVFAMTTSTSATFLRPVRTGRPYRVEAVIAGRTADSVETTARVVSASSGKVAAEARATFRPLDALRATSAIGRPAHGEDAGFVSGGA